MHNAKCLTYLKSLRVIRRNWGNYESISENTYAPRGFLEVGPNITASEECGKKVHW